MAWNEAASEGWNQRDAGAASPETVLCLHCSTGSSRQWRLLAEFLDTQFPVGTYRIIAPDLLGYGANHPWTPGRGHRLESEVRRLLSSLHDAPGPVHVVAHSFGAAVALRLALDHPYRVRSLTLYEPVLINLLKAEPDAGELLGEIGHVSTRVGAALADGDADASASHFIDFWSGPGTWHGMRDSRRANVRDRIHKVLADFDALLADGTTRADLSRLDIPSLCLSGAESPAATRRIVDILAATLPRTSSLRIEGAGHMGPLTHAGEVNSRVAEFLRFPASNARRAEHSARIPTARAA